MARRAVSLRTGYITLFILIIIFTALTAGSSFYLVMSRRSYARVQRDDAWLLSQLVESAEYLLQSAEDVSASLAFDNDLQSVLISYEYGEERPSLEETRLRINSILADKTRFNRALYDCRNIVLFSNDGKVVGSKEPYDMYTLLQDYPWAGQVMESHGRPLWLPLSYDPRSPSTNRMLSMPVARRIFSTQSGQSNSLSQTLTVGKPLGYLLVYFDSSLFSSIVSEYSRTVKSFYIVDGNGFVISSGQPEETGERLGLGNGDRYATLNGEECLLTSMPVGDTGWNYLCLTYRSEVERDGALVALVCVCLVLLLCAAFSVAGLFLSRFTAKPIYTLVGAFKRAEQETVVLDEDTMLKEFNYLFSSFNQTMDTIHDLDERVYRSLIEKQELAISAKESQIQALQNQINPHFLYNTLDSINWKALMNGDREVSEMICTLGKFFRSNIQQGTNEIPLREELANAELYIKLSKIRFGSRLRCRIVKEGDVDDIQVLRFLLQPLIENSIKHGIETTGKEENVTITASLGYGTLTISVKDDGPGMDESTLSYVRGLWEYSAVKDRAEGQSVGLSNVFRRLALTYYGRCEVVVLSSPGKGTEIIVRIHQV